MALESLSILAGASEKELQGAGHGTIKTGSNHPTYDAGACYPPAPPISLYMGG